MKTQKKLILGLSVILSVGIILNIGYGLDMYGEMKELNSKNLINVETVRFQDATVPCLEVEYACWGTNRDRVCSAEDNDEIDCEWADWSGKATLGTCTINTE